MPETMLGVTHLHKMDLFSADVTPFGGDGVLGKGGEPK